MNKRLGRVFANRTDDHDDEEELITKPFQVFSRTLTATAYEIYLSDVVIEPSAYDSLCALLRSLSANDAVTLFINSPGGNLASGMAIIQAMADCEAHITTVLHPRGYSMGALLFLAGDTKVVPPNCQLMLHHYSSALHGKGNEQVAEVNASVAWYASIVKDLCAGFLSEDELSAMLQGKDFWMQSEEIAHRLEVMSAEAAAANAIDS